MPISLDVKKFFLEKNTVSHWLYLFLHLLFPINPLFPHGWIAWNCTSLIMISSFPISGSWWSTPYHSPTKHEVPSAILWELRSTSKQVLNFNLMLTNPIYFFPWWSIQGRGFFFPFLIWGWSWLGKGELNILGSMKLYWQNWGFFLYDPFYYQDDNWLLNCPFSSILSNFCSSLRSDMLTFPTEVLKYFSEQH